MVMVLGQAPLWGAWPWEKGRGGFPGAAACATPPCAASGRAPGHGRWMRSGDESPELGALMNGATEEGAEPWGGGARLGRRIIAPCYAWATTAAEGRALAVSGAATWWEVAAAVKRE